MSGVNIIKKPYFIRFFGISYKSVDKKEQICYLFIKYKCQKKRGMKRNFVPSQSEEGDDLPLFSKSSHRFMERSVFKE
jgi:hypothetical protein